METTKTRLNENDQVFFNTFDTLVEEYINSKGESPFISIDVNSDENGEPISENGYVKLSVDMAKDFEITLQHKFKDKFQHASEVYFNEILHRITEELSNKEAQEEQEAQEA